MLLSRAAERGKEIAVRLSLGASRGRVVRQLLTESLLLASIAAFGGILLTLWLTRLLMAFEPPILPFPGMRLEFDFGLDARVLAYTVFITVATAVVFGLTPALRATRPDLVPALKEGGGAARSRHARLRSVLVAGQMAATIVLLIGSGLFLRALQSAQNVETGWDATRVHVGTFDLELNGYDELETLFFYDQLVARAAAIPGVEAAALAGKLPLAGASSTSMWVEGQEPPEGVTAFSVHNQSVSADYFRALQIPLLQGRSLRETDTGDRPMVAVVNKTIADRFWPGGAVGNRFYLGDFRSGARVPVEVVGVVADAKYHRPVEDPPFFAYFSFRQRPRHDLILHLRARPGADTSLLWGSVRAIVADLDPAVPLLDVAPLADALQIFWLAQRFAAWITAVVGFFGLLLGAVGTYGVTAYAVSRRSQEIGVRMALGARLSEVRRMMVRQGMVAPMLGMLVGLAIAAAATRLLEAFLVGVNPLDPVTFAGVGLLLASVALIATLAPARRASRVDPVVTLRSE